MPKVLVIHNRYRTSAPSGEDIAVSNEQRMLESRGVEVTRFERCNDDLDDSSILSKSGIAINTIWSARSRRELGAVIERVRPDIAHVHNTFSVLSPSIYGACRAAGVPVVQTLHNFRFFCPSALFLRDGKPCEACVDRSLLQAIRYRCYRGSLAATTTLVTMLAAHRLLGTYSRDIDRYITLANFAKAKVLRAGVAPGKVTVKPNFLPNPPPAGEGGGGYALYVGRFTEGKGTDTLIRAWQQLPDIPLRLIGDGELRPGLEAIARRQGLNAEFLGSKDRGDVLAAIRAADMLVVPSDCYEGFPMVAAEAFACGTPILASRIGSLDELVAEGVTGRKFPAGDASALAAGVRALLDDRTALGEMRSASRAYFDEHLTEEKNFAQLMGIYASVIAARALPDRQRRALQT